MKLAKVRYHRYRSLYDETVEFGHLNLFIGANAAGKSNILDGLRLLSEAVQEKDFAAPVSDRGGIIHLAWKGQDADNIKLLARFEDADDTVFEWTVQLFREGYDFWVKESLQQFSPGQPPAVLLESRDGRGWWWSKDRAKVDLDQPGTACALASAAADASFPARSVIEFTRRWGFFDPNPAFLRRPAFGLESMRLDMHGKNLAARLFSLSRNAHEVFDRIVAATHSVLGVPERLLFRESEDRVYFVQSEPGLSYTVHQSGVSSGTLRMLALMTALYGDTENSLVGIEEPENHVHPAALEAFAEHLKNANDRLQILVTTHSPLLLDYLNDPGAVCQVQRTHDGTRTRREANAEGVVRALEASGFRLGEFYETKGFGA